MSKLRRFRNSWSGVETFTNVSGPSRHSLKIRTGVDVSNDRAMAHAAVWACVRNRAEDVAKMPVRVVEYDGPVRLRRDAPPWLVRPNPETSTYELFERTMASVDMDGNAFWHVTRNKMGKVTEVWVLPPSAVSVYRDAPVRGQTTISPKRFTYAGTDYSLDEVVHFTGFSVAGRLRGLNPIQQHMHSIGLSIAAEEFGEAFFGNGATMSGIVEMPGMPERQDVSDMQEGLARDQQGIDNAWKPGVLWGGAKWVQLSIPNDAAQFLETRKYQLADIARIWRMPSHKINDLEHATFSNIEHQSIEYVTDALLPAISRLEATILGAGLLDQGQHLKFNPAVLLRGDTKTRYESYAIAITNGWLSPDDVRELEDLNPLPDDIGGQYLRQLNLTPLAKAEAGSSPVEIANLVQKIYLGVGTVLTEAEARDIANRAGAGLNGPGPSEQLALFPSTSTGAP